MTSFFRSWLSAPVAAAPDVPQLLKVSPPASDDEGEGTETEDNSVPAFPALNSAQRAAPSKPPRILSDSALMPPPPVPSLAARTPGVSNKSSASSSLLVPTTTTRPPKPSNKKREKVALTPGHSPLDWAALKSSGTDLRDDAWTAINNKVYNITAYLPFHPGGERELMRVAGRDGTYLFASTHAWVNADFMLDTCLVGFLISEPATDSP
ncbi:cytochrome b5-like heme/steroid binding domain-containing protein [Mycena galopus ATCC 62051]|nr:cytochrome b5-like heme/steroid binding domain-containing protein [Mycena galopus ATCC 62051]